MRLATSTSLTLLLLAPPAAAQSRPAPGVAPAFTTSGAFFALSVSNLEATRAWYVEKLGLGVAMQPPPHEGVRALVLEGGGLIVEVIHNPLAQPPRAVSNPTLTYGVFKVGLVVDDLDSALARLRERGVPIALGPFPARDGQRANFAIHDNAGNLIQFFAR
jgi:catechol 2,3-dioxygenase-like lactoylglutathione lyase family enzyme